MNLFEITMKTRTWLVLSLPLLVLCSCQQPSSRHSILVSVADQKMAVYKEGKRVATYPVSTSKFGLGDIPGSNRTPVGRMKVVQKIGGGQPLGMVFRGRQPTGEVLRPNQPGRDPVVTRILRLQGTEPSTRNAYNRFIYIHGTPEEYKIGTPASYGCIRMKSRDVMELYNKVREGVRVDVTTRHLPTSAMSSYSGRLAGAGQANYYAKSASEATTGG